MVAQRVPRQLADETVILVKVVSRVSEDQVGLDSRLQLLERVLDLAADVREEAVAKAVDDDLVRSRRLARNASALARASSARAPSARGRPRSPRLRRCGWQREQRRAAADLDVVRVAPSASTRAAARRRVERKAEHQRRGAALDRARYATAAGRSRASASRRCLSLIVSIGSQKPS